MTKDWIQRTTFKEKEKGSEEQCPYCKNQDIQKLRKDFDLDSSERYYFSNIYKDREFEVWSCFMCSAKWSFPLKELDKNSP